MENFNNNSGFSDFKEEENNFKLIDLFYIVKMYWYWFLLSLIICISAAIYQIKKTPRTYSRTGTILIKDNSRGVGMSESAALGEINMFQTKSNLDNEIFIMKSRQLMTEVVNRLNLNVSYTIKNGLRTSELYTQSPIILGLPNSDNIQSFAFEATLVSKNKIELSNFSNNPEKTITVNINDSVMTPVGKLIFIPSLYFSDEYMDKTIRISRQNPIDVADYYRGAININVTNQAANIIALNLIDQSTLRAEDIINTLIGVYNETTINNKNQVAINTSKFINERLVVIEKELNDVDAGIASYKSEMKVSDISSEMGVYVQDSRQYNKEVLELENQLKLTKYIRDYLVDPKNNSATIPALTGASDAGIESNINKYNNLFLEREKLISNSSEKNPVILDLNNSLLSMKQNIIQTIDNYIMSLNMQITNSRAQEAQTNYRLSSIPVQQKEILSVGRQQKIKEELYLYLLNKREESVLSQTMTESNARVIDVASGSNAPVAPKKQKIMMMAIALGLAIPSGIIWLIYALNVNVRSRKDLEHSVSIPLLGEIPLKNKKDKEDIVVLEDRQDSIAEAFRIIRTNLYFMQTNGDKNHQVAMFTSFNPSAGKTFISTNLAMSFILAQKKVILIDLDIRKRTLSKQTKNNRNTGITNFLSGMVESVEEIISKNEIMDQLDVIHAGTVPPNPTELLLSNRLELLINELKKRYDYIFLDNVPAGMVADASIVNRVADTTIYVVRAGKTDRRMLPELEKLYRQRKFKNMCLILNAVQTKYMGYGRGYGYGYGYGYGNKK